MLDFSTFNLLKCNISSKKKTFLNVGPKVFYSDIFGLKLEDATVRRYFTLAPSNLSKYKISLKNKNPLI